MNIGMNKKFLLSLSSDERTACRELIIARRALAAADIPLVITGNNPTVKEKEKAMYDSVQSGPTKLSMSSSLTSTSLNNTVTAQVPTEQRQIVYFVQQARDAMYKKEEELRKKFGLVDDEFPRTANEVIKRIKDGNIVVDPMLGDQPSCCPLDCIRFRDPKLEPNYTGYDAASEKLVKLYSSVERQIVASSTPADIKDAISRVEEIENFQAQ